MRDDVPHTLTACMREQVQRVIMEKQAIERQYAQVLLCPTPFTLYTLHPNP